MMRLMSMLLALGLLLVSVGIYLICCTDITDAGDLQSMGLVVGLLTIGLVILIPAKVYIIVKLTRRRRP